MESILTLRIKKPTLSNVAVWLILLIPIFKYYELPFVGLGMEAFMVFFALLSCIVNSLQSRYELDARLTKSARWFLASGIWLLLVTLFYELSTNINLSTGLGGYSINTIVVLFLTIFLIWHLLRGEIDFEDTVNAYAIIVWFLVAVYIFQWLLVSIGVSTSFKLPFFSFANAWSKWNGENFGMSSYPTSLFSERSHFCQYLIPYIAICLYSDKIISKGRYAKAISISIVALSTISGNGVICVAIIWLMYALMFGTFQKKYRILVVGLIVVVLLLGYTMLSSIPTFDKMFSQLFTSGDTNYVKADYRIYRGIDIFLKLPSDAKVYGIGYKHMEAFASFNHIVSEYDLPHTPYEYFSSISQLLIYSGVIGTLLYTMHLILLYRYSPKCVKGLIVIQCALFFSTEIIYLNDHIMYSLIMVSVYKQLIKEQRQGIRRDL